MIPIPLFILAIENDEDRAFFEQLYLDYYKLLYGEAFKILNNHWDTEDVLQITLVKLIDKTPELKKKDRKRLANYIVVAVKNTAINYLRDNKRGKILSIDDSFDYSYSHDDIRPSETILIGKEQLQSLIQNWSALDKRSRFVLEGKYILKKNDEELSHALGIKVESVRMILTRARKKAYALIK